MLTILAGITLAAVPLVILFMFMADSSRSSRRKKLASEQDIETLRRYAESFLTIQRPDKKPPPAFPEV